MSETDETRAETPTDPETNTDGIVRQRCFHHRRREAAARCPECGRFYCRECVTEHGGRVVCAACLKKMSSADRPRRARLRAVMNLLRPGAAFFVLWYVFYLVGRVLLMLPSSFHEGALWRDLPLNPL